MGTISHQQVTDAIYRAIERVNEDLPAKERIAKTPEAALFGAGGGLDSLALVNLIVCLEQIIAADLGRSVTIANEKAVSQRNSPFRTVRSLADFVHEMLNDSHAAS